MDTRIPPENYLTEQPWHRTAAYLAAQGMMYKEIAKAVNKSANAVSMVSRQPWWRKLVSELIAEQKIGETAQAMLQAMIPEAMFTLQTMLTAESESVRLKAAEGILDRVLGKAPQRQDLDLKINDPREEAERLDREIARLLNSDTATNVNPDSSNG